MKKIYIILISIFAFSLVQAQQNKFNLVVGTYTTPCESKGIYVYDFDSNTGNVTLKIKMMSQVLLVRLHLIH